MNQEQHQQFMRRAIALARQNISERNGGPFGAVVVKDGKIIGEGWNKVTERNDPTAHAEMEAIRAACAALRTFDLSGAIIYTSCEPCPMCLSAIYWARLDKIYFANTRQDAADIQFDDDFIYQEIAKDHDQRGIHMTQILRDEALPIFTDWQKKSAKIRY
ncbi:MAG: nucleoside deaminase [Planctomycetes bacterium]|nr:nucleoside deaminase [Planctomycetota bacterium]